MCLGKQQCKEGFVFLWVAGDRIKSEWRARRNIVWTGFVLNTVCFKLWVREEKLVRVEGLLEDLWNKRKERVKVRKLAKVAGVIGSFTLAMGNVARF